MPSKFISYGKQWLDDEEIQSVINVLESNFLTQGPIVEQFEQDICNYTGSKYCIAVSNGTAALHISVSALNIEQGMEGITTPNTFLATPNSMLYNDIHPIFADINPKTYNISIKSIKEKITPNTRLIMPVHFAGQPCKMDQIQKIAKNNDLYIIEDAAHAIGSKYSDGSRVGNCKFSDITIFSFHPVKTMTTGEGGAITTNDKELYEKLKRLRDHGINRLNDSAKPWLYEMIDLGFNYRLTDMQAALGLVQLKKLDYFIRRRREIVSIYNESFKDVEIITIPYESDNIESAFHLYVLLINFGSLRICRGDLINQLKSKGIGTQVHYIPIYLQPYYKNKFNLKSIHYKNSNSYYNKTLSIPLYPKMTNDDVRYVINSIISICK